MTPPAVFLRVGGTQRVLGQAFEPEEIPELLRHVADYYDDNPDACTELFNGPANLSGSPSMLNPFGVGSELH